MNAFLPRPARLLSRAVENQETITLELDLPEPAYRFEPGQFNMLYAFGKGEAAISISGTAADRGLFHTIQGVGTVSRALAELEPGECVGLRGPFGRGWPVEKALGRDLLIVAGGIGLAPLRPVVHRVLRERSRFGRVVLCYGSRAPQHMIFREELESWRGRFDFEVLITVDLGDRSWRGNVGVVTTLLQQAALGMDLPGGLAFLCGPPIMIRFTSRDLAAMGMPAESIHVSLERNMKCGLGVCGHCQFGPYFLCQDGPVFNLDELGGLWGVREL